MISALAITYNEEEHIERFIKSLSFADEIVVVDSYSTDKTVDIAERLGAKIIKRVFDNFSAQKNFALEQAKNDWVVFFDADETIPESLAQEIKEKIVSNSKSVAYKIKRKFHFMGKHLKYSGLQNDSAIRVFNKVHCSYNTNLVDETLIVNGDTEPLKHKSDHYSYKSFDAFNDKLSHHSKLQAISLYKKNKRPKLYHFLFKPWWRFFHQYIIKLGVLDGKEGFILAYCNAFAVFKRYLYLWTMYRNIE